MNDKLNNFSKPSFHISNKSQSYIWSSFTHCTRPPVHSQWKWIPFVEIPVNKIESCESYQQFNFFIELKSDCLERAITISSVSFDILIPFSFQLTRSCYCLNTSLSHSQNRTCNQNVLFKHRNKSIRGTDILSNC